MYAKLILRGLSRHRKKGKRLFILLALCSAAMIFTLTFQTSFTSRYEAMGIDLYTAHLAVLPTESPKLKEGFFATNKEKLELMDYSGALKDRITSDPRVETAALLLETTGMLQTLENENQPFYSLIGVEPDLLGRIFPGVQVLSSSGPLTWNPAEKEIPLYRPLVEFWERVKNPEEFIPGNLKLKGTRAEEFFRQASQELGLNPLSGESGFLEALNRFLKEGDFLAKIKPLVDRRLAERYQETLDNALADLENNREPQRWPALKKRVLRALYPQALSPVQEEPTLNRSLTLTVPPAAQEGVMTSPLVLPVVYKGFVQRFPLYFWNSYMDIRVLREELGLKESQGTSLYLRAKNLAEVPGLKRDLESLIKEHNLDLKVADYQYLGRMHMSTAQAFSVIGGILIGLFLLTVGIFIINSILLALIQRRREIGTAVALGLSPVQNLLVFLGETGVLVTVSWIIGAVLGGLMVWAFTVWGLPGMIFFPGDTLYFLWNPGAFGTSYLMILLTAGFSALLPLLGLLKKKPVDLLKEGQ